MKNGNINDVVLRLVYALNEYKDKKNTTLVLGAGCSLTSTDKDVSTIGIMKECLLEHHIPKGDASDWEEIYRLFSNIVWDGKTESEKRELLNKRFRNMKPTSGHMIIKALLEKGYIHNIITTNFDMLIEEACKDLSFSKRIGNEEYHNIGDGQPSFNLLKVHGDLESGKLRFSPSELKKLPDDLEADINQKTSGLTLVLGYRGQDIGLMNSIYTGNSSSIYWINISGPLGQEYFEAEQISELLSLRESTANIIDGKEYGDFQNFLSIINEFLITQSHPNIIDTEKSKIIGRWEKTSIIDILSQNYKMYTLFANLLYISEKISSEHYDLKSYQLYLDAYLFFFKSDILPSKLITIPYNEIDALMLGVSIETLIRTQINHIDTNEYIDNLRKRFENEYFESILLDLSFWDAIKNLINLKYRAETNTVKINFCNQNLNMESVEIPLENLKELMQIVRILSAINLPYEENNKYRAFSGKNERFENVGDRIYIDLGEINDNDKAFVTDYWIKNLPERNVVIERNRMIIYSKWLEITFKFDNYESYEMNSIYELCLVRCKKTTEQFLNLGSTVKEKHEKLNLDDALSNFINSEKVAMFIVGQSGYGKTASLKNYIRENSNYFFIAVSSKNSNIEKSGISLFLDIKECNHDEDFLLETLNNAFEQRQSMLILILDGINELSFVDQKINYIKSVELSEKLYKLNCKHIKLIITCRNHAYSQYKESTGLYLNPLYFYNNKMNENESILQNDASYSLNFLNAKELTLLSNCYIPSNVIITDKNLLPNVTPLYFAILGEYLENNKDIQFVINESSDFYEIFSKTMLSRLSQTNSFLAKKIIYTYFDLVIKYNTINITFFMVQNEIILNSHIEKTDALLSVFNELMDINIFVDNSLQNQKIKFTHDKIEEFFFTNYLEESVILDNLIFDQIMSLAREYLIYRSSCIQFLINKAKNNLGEFKDIVIVNSSSNMDILPKMEIKSLCCLNDIKRDLQYLLHERDYKKSKIFLNIMISGLEESLLSYSLASQNLMCIIDTIINLSTQIVNDEAKSYMYYFKSKLFYFKNDYRNALDTINQALSLANNLNGTLIRKINVHRAIIWMELGYSKNSIDILQIEYEKCKDSDTHNKVRIGVELGRALNHSGQIDKPLQVYEDIYQYEEQISSSYLLARIYGEKANILNKKMFKILNFGFTPVSDLSPEDLNNVNKWCSDIVTLFNRSIELLEKDNDIFCYSGTVPELINTYIAYSMSVHEKGIDECTSLIHKLDMLFKSITTPYKIDFNLAKAYYYEYLGDISKAIEHIQLAKQYSVDLKNKFKEAKCNIFYSQFAYRRILSSSDYDDISYWKHLSEQCVNDANDYYMEYTKIEDNRNLEICEKMKKLLKAR